jgi:hypothetical protein
MTDEKQLETERRRMILQQSIDETKQQSEDIIEEELEDIIAKLKRKIQENQLKNSTGS